MSELEKLTFKWQKEHSKRFTKHLGQYYAQVDKLQKDCKHEKTHWLQEIAKDGTFKDDLVKRCFVCGANVEKFTVKIDVIEQIMVNFDKDVEQKKVLGVNKQ